MLKLQHAAYHSNAPLLPRTVPSWTQVEILLVGQGFRLWILGFPWMILQSGGVNDPTEKNRSKWQMIWRFWVLFSYLLGFQQKTLPLKSVWIPFLGSSLFHLFQRKFHGIPFWKGCYRDLFFTLGMVGSLTGSPVLEVSPAPQHELRHETHSGDNFAGIGLFTRKNW